jgi:hypothetical protein
MSYKKMLIAFLAACFSQMAPAAEINPLIGKWSTKFQNGNVIIHEFTETTTSTTPYGPDEKQLDKTNAFPVTYKKLGKSDLGEGYGIEFEGKNGKPGGGIMVFLKSEDVALMDFPGAGAYPINRVKE